jgi:hypothetical protein
MVVHGSTHVDAVASMTAAAAAFAGLFFDTESLRHSDSKPWSWSRVRLRPVAQVPARPAG